MFPVREKGQVPSTWEVVTLADACAVNPSTDFSCLKDEDLLTFVPMQLVEERTGKLDASNLAKVAKVRKGYTRFEEGDVLFAKITPCMENGKVALATNLHNGLGAGSTEFHVLRPYQRVERKYILFYLLQVAFRHDAQHRMTGTAGQKRVPAKYIEGSEIPLPPLNEQRRIVSKIEELFSDLDAGEASLRKVQQLLATYRKSVLKAAVTGELTREWRAANAQRLESGEALLQRILQARRAQWQGRGKYVEPQLPDTRGLPELPEGWTYATPAQLASSDPHALSIGPFGSNLKVEDYRESGVPLVFVRHIRARRFDGLKPQYVSQEKARELAAHKVVGGDLLITKMGEPPGDVAVYPLGSGDAIITADCIRFSPAHDFISSRFLECGIRSHIVQRQIQDITKGVAQQKVTLVNFKRIAIPLVSQEEQAEIVSLVDDIFSRINALETWCATELARSGALRQSTLKAAFAGQLVPQDPDDEPASVLLERIHAERAAIPARRGHHRRDKETETEPETVQETLW
jgi:type I restriction enzyme S subunit